MISFRQRIAQMSEGDLEGFYAELSFGIENGEFSGDVLAEAIRERGAVWQEIIRIRLGGVDNDEEDADWDCPPDACYGVSEDYDCGHCPFQDDDPEGW